MKNLFVLIISVSIICSCEERAKHVSDSADIEYGDSNMRNNGVQPTDSIYLKPEKQSDIDSISLESNHLLRVKNLENNHFSMDIEFPSFDHGVIDRNIMEWINEHLQTSIEDTIPSDADDEIKKDFEEYKKSYNMKYDGDVMDVSKMAQFYCDKHFSLFKGAQLGIDYNITCRKIYESKDIVSYEIHEFYSNYAIMQSNTNVCGATFFKYNGQQLKWNMFVDTNVKEVLKQEVNQQFLKFPQQQYEEYLSNSKYREFTLPENPPYMVKDGLKFVYKHHEMSDKEKGEQINCTVPSDKINLLPSLADLLN